MKNSNIIGFLAFVVLVMLIIFSINSDGQEDAPSRRIVQPDLEVLRIAKQAVYILKAQDGKRLASLAHPKKGIRFSPYAFIDIDNDLVFSSTQIESFWADKKVYMWGYEDGTGDPINMTPNQYYHRYIMDRDFLKPSSININHDRAFGNTKNNAALIYPHGTRVEFYIEPTIRDGTPGLDWTALRLVFEKSSDSWFLIAVIHDEWTT